MINNYKSIAFTAILCSSHPLPSFTQTFHLRSFIDHYQHLPLYYKSHQYGLPHIPFLSAYSKPSLFFFFFFSGVWFSYAIWSSILNPYRKRFPIHQDH